MLFFCTSEQSLNGFFSQHVNFFIPQSMTDVLTGFQILFPDMPVDYFLMFFTFRAFGKIRTVFTDAFITLVFFVTIPVCCPISKDLIRRTDIAVMLYAKTCLCSPFRNQPLSGSEASGALTYYEERREFLSIYA